MSAGAAMAVDDDADTYWASKFDDTNTPVEYVIDFGEVQKLSSMELSWEFPARSFAVAASVDGEHFTDVYATDANVVKSSRISLGGAAARRLRISMLEVRGLRVARYFFLSLPFSGLASISRLIVLIFFLLFLFSFVLAHHFDVLCGLWSAPAELAQSPLCASVRCVPIWSLYAASSNVRTVGFQTKLLLA